LKVVSFSSATIADTAGSRATALHDRHREWIEARGISVELAEKMGLHTVQRSGKAWLAVPYVERGRVVNHKYRLISEKRHEMDKGGRLILWNHDCLLEESKTPVVICEGEWDALVAMSMGWRAVSVPNGASGGEGELSYLWEARDLLNRVQSFILATDSDEAGLKLRSNLIAHLGADRCAFVESYGTDCKDLNETLQRYGAEAASQVLMRAKPMPVKGLYTIDDFPERPELTVWQTGIEPLNDIGDYQKPALSVVPGTLTVLTGHANMGKSTLIDGMVAHFLKGGIPVCIASFETDVKPILVDGIRCAMLGIGDHELRTADTRACDTLIRSKLQIISQSVDEDEEMNVEYFLELCRVAVLRHGVRLVILDPWNELEHKMRQGEQETVYIGRALRAIKRFAKVYDVAFWIVAHPTKPFEGKVRMPRLLDISGSANWANKADFGLSYHRGERDIAELCVTKVRKGYPGRRGSVKVTYDFRQSRFVEAPIQ
jgi:twinkle protein